MKLRNFNLEDVFGSNDVEQAKAYIGKRGYYADLIEDLDDYIENKSHIDKLYAVDEDLGILRYVIGRSYDYNNNYNYFLPLEKVKKTEPAEKEVKYRSLRNKEELIDFICKNTNSQQVIGAVICIRKKDGGQTTVTTITAITHYYDLLSDKTIYEITLGTGKTYSLECLFGLFEIIFDDNYQWQPFGVEVKNED